MKIQNRIELLAHLGKYLQNGSSEWQQTQLEASQKNPWFIPEFITLSIKNIAEQFLDENKLSEWVNQYQIPENSSSNNIGIVMAGNIPMVGFHDFLCAFVCGHKQTIKLSSKDDVLLKHLVTQMIQWEPKAQELVAFAENLKSCDAYIATGSNNSARYFDYYFSKYPHVIRRNRTSAAILNGKESPEQLELLADDISVFFGLGCRNVTKLFVPGNYDFIPLLEALKKYSFLGEHHKYKNNYDYYLSIQIMNNRFYMTNGSIVLVENDSLFSPISQLNYSFFTDEKIVLESLTKNPDVQCLIGSTIPFGNAQKPALNDYADGVDTMQFLLIL